MTHEEIVERAGVTDEERAGRLGVKKHQVRDWRLRNRIPQEAWKAVASAGVATLEELAEAAALRRAS